MIAYNFNDKSNVEQVLIKEKLKDLNLKNINDVTISNNFELLDILKECFNYETDILVFENEKVVVGYIAYAKINGKIISLPHFSYAGHLIDYDYSNQINLLLKSYFYNNHQKFLIRSKLEFSKYIYSEKVTYFLRLEKSSDDQLKKFKSKLRSQISKALKNQITISEGRAEYCDVFFKLYSKNNHRLGSTILPRKFFDLLLQNYTDSRVFVAFLDGEAIATGFVLSYLGFSEVCWASSNRQFKHYAPNMLLYWKMIEHSIEKKQHIFSFGRSSKDSSTAKFKEQWGADKVLLEWSGDEAFSNYSSFSFFSFLWKLLPYKLVLFISRFVSKFFY